MGERESSEYKEGKREPFEWGFRGETEISSSFDQLVISISSHNSMVSGEFCDGILWCDY